MIVFVVIERRIVSEFGTTRVGISSSSSSEEEVNLRMARKFAVENSSTNCLFV